MLHCVLMVALVISAATEVLRYDSSKHSTSINEPHVISRGEQSERYKNNDHVSEETDSTGTNIIHCKIILNHIADCSHQGISDLNQLTHLSDEITVLDLSFNNISYIADQVFLNFTKLEWLSISHNNLQYLNNDSFFGLLALKVLHLHGNNLSMSQQTYPVNVFKPLENLQVLMIHNNTQVNDSKLNYPHEALAHLRALKYLHLDGLPNKTLGEGFRLMTSLTNLTFTGSPEGHCNLQSLPNDTFQYVTGVTDLELIHCNIKGTLVQPGVFLPLPNLTSLDVSHNDALKFESLGTALNTIRNNTKMKILKMSNIVNPYSPGICVTNEFAKSLPRYLEELNASSNSMGTLEMKVLQNMPKSLRVVDVSSNKFAFGSYLKDLDKLESLQVLILGGGDVYDLPRYYPPDTHVVNQCKDEVSSTIDSLVDTFCVNNQCNTEVSSTVDSLVDTLFYLSQRLPPNLQELNANNAWLSNHLTEFHFNQTNTLKILILDSNNFPVVKGPIYGLNYLRNLSMSGCKIKEIYPTFFQFFRSLEILNLSNNLFGDRAVNSNQPVFINLTKLKVLDLSFTNIWRISRNAFQGLGSLEFLFLQKNPIMRFSVDISHMNHLTFINLTYTNVVSLSHSMTQELDRIKQISEHFTIDISENIVHCFCSKITFIKWLTRTHVLSNTTQITCSFEDGKKKTVDNLEEIYARMRKQCDSHLEAFSLVISATFVVILAIIGAIIFRFRWKLRYLYYSAVLHYRKQKTTTNDESFEFDVFVSYAHEDHYFVEHTLYEELQKRGLRVLIHGKHFTAGDFITANIVNAVQTSRRTLVVLTQNLFNSQWSRYEIQMANMEQDHTGRSVLLFLLMENLPHLPNDIRVHVAKNTYIDFPNTANSQQDNDVFWSKLVSDLNS